jgi:regulatory protein
MWVESRQRTRGVATSALRQELRRKGIEDALVEAALSGIDPDSERERARQLVRVKARTMSRLDPQVRVRRLVGMLQRRGYSGAVAYGVVLEVLGDDVAEVGVAGAESFAQAGE